ncbi:hypothetical protein M0G74_04425 [Microbulbifer sp. CAU 1566]|uniref:hypothetical protein n=1 Tax=Microbulbifer sp. CAU 1566 TaxID=2933269 RepID=UPI0020044BC1|nr:hypothetical protein [Microbulbifer sp. CAU 1566]MCK7596516.1 hypothetical protein [Microbulbifer sp. CAU 1566]
MPKRRWRPEEKVAGIQAQATAGQIFGSVPIKAMIDGFLSVPARQNNQKGPLWRWVSPVIIFTA